MEPGQMSYWNSIVKELVDTEHSYVKGLENLCDLKKTLQESGVIPENVIRRVFLNIDAIHAVQKLFLIRLEAASLIPHDRQEWGSSFVAFEDTFKIYVPFIANYRKAVKVVREVFDKIQSVGHPIACDFYTLYGCLMRPLSRLAKYPLLLKELRKKSENDAVKSDLSAGILAAERVLETVNEAVHRDLLDGALEDLTQRVTDWKTHQLDQFGKLILHGTYSISVGSSNKEKDYEIYLFEHILLCCKEAKTNKSKSEKDETESRRPKINENRKPLQLMGRIFMADVTDVVAKPERGIYIVQIWWRGDQGVESFIIKFRNVEFMKKWSSAILEQQKANRP